MRRSLTFILVFGLLAPLSCTLLVDFEPTEVTPEDCHNGMDDDGDGYADCRDQDCWHLPKCANLYEDCSNWMDDDGDGDIDCDDSDCAMSENCWGQSDLCNGVAGNEELQMYTEVYPDSAAMCPPMMSCRIERISSDGVPRCLRAEGFRAALEPCDNDLECPDGHVCQWSDTISPFTGNHRPVCLPLCATLFHIGCPDGLLCMNLWTVYDGTGFGEPLEVFVSSCDKPLCDVLKVGFATCQDTGNCYPEPDMMGQGYCAPSGLSGHLVRCDRDSDCLPRYRCHLSDGGDAGQCRRVCLGDGDCTGLGVGGLENLTCVRRPSWATYGVCDEAPVGW